MRGAWGWFTRGRRARVRPIRTGTHGHFNGPLVLPIRGRREAARSRPLRPPTRGGSVTHPRARSDTSRATQAVRPARLVRDLLSSTTTHDRRTDTFVWRMAVGSPPPFAAR